MVCSIIGDIAVNERVLRRLEREIENIIEIYDQCFFLVGDMSEFEIAASEIVRLACRKSYFAGYNTVTCKQTDALNTIYPDEIWMVKDEYVDIWRNTWMLKKSTCAIIGMKNRDKLPKIKTIAPMDIIDVSEK
ncbi:MAG: hypothetical protein IJC56_00915 [Clostridia bacterium]|nr:hypothetical protein [Clostridia bacterium]